MATAAAVSALTVAYFLTRPAPDPAVVNGMHLVFVEGTHEDAEVALPDEVEEQLHQLGLAHGQLTLTRITSSGGSITEDPIDMTPRLANGHVVKVRENARPIIDREIAQVVATINDADAATGGRALYAGLSQTTFTPGEPVVIVASGIDTSNPDDFRRLAWKVPPAEVIAKIRASGHEAQLRQSPVTFVLVPAAGHQNPSGRPEREYTVSYWTQSLISAEASSVAFVDAPDTNRPAARATAPTVTVSNQPGTPIHRGEKKNPTTGSRTVSCVVPEGYFEDTSPKLRVKQSVLLGDLRPCVTEAVTAKAKFHLDGYTSYDGPLTKVGKPAVDSQFNRWLSRQRNATIAQLLLQLDVPKTHITSVGHGNMDQPYPQDPTSEKNRVVIISYTIPRTT